MLRGVRYEQRGHKENAPRPCMREKVPNLAPAKEQNEVTEMPLLTYRLGKTQGV
jgi:hypothetical protein